MWGTPTWRGGGVEGMMDTTSLDMNRLAIDSAPGNGNGNGHGGHPATEAVADVWTADDLGRLPALLESLLFAARAPVLVARLVEALDGPGRAEVGRALGQLAVRHDP